MKPVQYIIAGLALLLALSTHQATAANGPALIRDAEIEQSLRTMSTPVFKQAGLSPQTVRFVLVENNELNAFVAGGQNIFLHTGLILKTENAEELVGVIAHETGHIALGHLFRQKEEIENLSFESMLIGLFGLAVGLSSGKADVGIASMQAGQNIALRQFLRHTRTQEGSADQAGVKFLQGSSLPVTGFLSFMEKLKNQELLPESEQSEYVRTHPLTQDRVDFLEFTVAQEKPRQTPEEWQALHRRMKVKLLGYLFPDRALQDRSDSVEARYGRAIAYYRQNKIDKATDLLDPLIKEEPENPYFYELKGQMLLEHGRIAESLPFYEKAVTFAPKSGLIRAAYGHALLEAGEKYFTEAVKQLSLSLETEPRSPSTHRMLAIVYGKQGKEGLSRLHLAEAALLRGDPITAIQEATRAQKALGKGSPGGLRAQDILSLADKVNKNKR